MTRTPAPILAAIGRCILPLALGGLLALAIGCDRIPVPSAQEPRREPIARTTPKSAASNDEALPECCKPGPDAEAPAVATRTSDETLVIPDVEVLDQDGRTSRFATDLIRGRPFAVNFLFTTCRGVCPALGASFAKLRLHLSRSGARDVAIISISVDPQTDTPERLRAWRSQFGDLPGWTLVTGDKRQVDRLLRALGAFAADKNQHTQAILLGDGRRARERSGGLEVPVVRIGGLSPPEEVGAALRRLLAHATPDPDRPRAPAEEYFTKWYTQGADGRSVKSYRDITLTDQDGRSRRFYGDLLAERCVVVHAFFGSCTGACPKMLDAMRRLQDRLGTRLGRDVLLVSLSVDPQADTPERLKTLAVGLGARPGWYFLTGDPGDVAGLMRKIQPDFDGKLTHSTRLYIGNLRTNRWAKPDIATYPADQVLDAAERIFDRDARPDAMASGP